MARHSTTSVILLCGAALVALSVAGTSDEKKIAEVQKAASPEVVPPAASPSQSASAGVPVSEVAASAQAARNSEERIQQALDSKITLSVENATWDEVAATIAKQLKVNVAIDKASMATEGIADERFDGHYENVPARTALTWLFDFRNGAFVIDDQSLILTTVNAAHRRAHFRVFDVSRLLKSGFTEDSVIDVTLNNTTGPWEEISGEGGAIFGKNGVFSVVQNSNVQHEVKQFLESLSAASAHPASAPPAVFGVDPADAAVVAALKQPISAKYHAMPFMTFIDDIRQRMKAPVHIDPKFVKAKPGYSTSLTEHAPVTGEFQNMTIESVLNTLLPPLKLCATVDRGRLLVTDDSTAQERLVTLVYTIQDFAAAEYDEDELMNVIVESTPGPWESISGEGSPDPGIPATGQLVVRCMWSNHEKVAQLLSEIRQTVIAPKLKEKAAAPVDPQAFTTVVYDDFQVPIDDLVPAIPQFVLPDTWQQNGKGGAGIIQKIGKTIVVRQSNQVHAEIRTFLKQLKESKAKGARFGGGLSFFRVDQPSRD